MNSKTLLAWIAVFISSFILDSIGHLVIAGQYITQQLGNSIAPMGQSSFPPIIVEYLLVSAGIVYFLKETNASSKPASYAAKTGAVIGLLVYGISGLINTAFLEHWPLSVVTVNTIIGVVVLAAAAALGHKVMDKKS